MNRCFDYIVLTESCLLITNQYQNSSIYILDRFVKKTKVTNGWLPIRGLLIRFFQKNENRHILICIRCLKMFWNDVCNVDAQSTSKHVYSLSIAEMAQFHFQKFWMAMHFETITHNLILIVSIKTLCWCVKSPLNETIKTIESTS